MRQLRATVEFFLESSRWDLDGLDELQRGYLYGRDLVEVRVERRLAFACA